MEKTKRITLIAPSADFGNIPGIYAALRTQVNHVDVVLRTKNKKQMWRELPHISFGYRYIPARVDKCMVVSGCGFNEVYNYLMSRIIKDIRVILTDSYYRNNYEKVNKLLQHYTVYCMPDVIPYYDSTPRMFYPPFEQDGIGVEKNSVLTIAHSPFDIKKTRRKGTQLIEDIVRGIQQQANVQYDRITSISWRDCLRRKARAHIFIDQLVEEDGGYRGGLGKSGIEAMALGCTVLSSGNFSADGDIPPPPVVRITRDTIYDVLLRLVNDPSERDSVADAQRQWVQQYASYKFVGKHLLQ